METVEANLPHDLEPGAQRKWNRADQRFPFVNDSARRRQGWRKNWGILRVAGEVWKRAEPVAELLQARHEQLDVVTNAPHRLLGHGPRIQMQRFLEHLRATLH